MRAIHQIHLSIKMIEDFISKANLAAKTVVENPAEVIAKDLVNDRPSIETAVKSYLSLLAARNLSDEKNCSELMKDHEPRILDQKVLLACARILLERINTFSVPDIPLIEYQEVPDELKYKTLRIIWNNFVSSSNTTTDKPKRKDQKPARFLGRSALLIVYPMILSEIKSQTPVIPNFDEEEEILAFFEYFGTLLESFQEIVGDINMPSPDTEDDDSQLIWAKDRGERELARRRERRASKADKRSTA